MNLPSIESVRATATQQLTAAGMKPALGAGAMTDGLVQGFAAGYYESQKPEWDNVRLLLIARIEPCESDPEDPPGEFPPHWHIFELVPVTATGDMLAPITPKMDGKVGKVRSADVGRAYLMGWAYGKWEMYDGQAQG